MPSVDGTPVGEPDRARHVDPKLLALWPSAGETEPPALCARCGDTSPLVQEWWLQFVLGMPPMLVALCPDCSDALASQFP